MQVQNTGTLNARMKTQGASTLLSDNVKNSRHPHQSCPSLRSLSSALLHPSHHDRWKREEPPTLTPKPCSFRASFPSSRVTSTWPPPQLLPSAFWATGRLTSYLRAEKIPLFLTSFLYLNTRKLSSCSNNFGKSF